MRHEWRLLALHIVLMKVGAAAAWCRTDSYREETDLAFH